MPIYVILYSASLVEKNNPRCKARSLPPLSFIRSDAGGYKRCEPKRTKKHWAWIPRDTLDAVIIRLDTAYQRFFIYKKNGGKKVGLPKLKKPHKMRSAKFPTGYRLENGRLRISFKTWNDKTQSLKF